jgi:hypothetical protein
MELWREERCATSSYLDLIDYLSSNKQAAFKKRVGEKIVHYRAAIALLAVVATSLSLASMASADDRQDHLDGNSQGHFNEASGIGDPRFAPPQASPHALHARWRPPEGPTLRGGKNVLSTKYSEPLRHVVAELNSVDARVIDFVCQVR